MLSDDKFYFYEWKYNFEYKDDRIKNNIDQFRGLQKSKFQQIKIPYRYHNVHKKYTQRNKINLIQRAVNKFADLHDWKKHYLFTLYHLEKRSSSIASYLKKKIKIKLNQFVNDSKYYQNNKYNSYSYKKYIENYYSEVQERCMNEIKLLNFNLTKEFEAKIFKYMYKFIQTSSSTKKDMYDFQIQILSSGPQYRYKLDYHIMAVKEYKDLCRYKKDKLDGRTFDPFNYVSAILEARDIEYDYISYSYFISKVVFKYFKTRSIIKKVIEFITILISRVALKRKINMFKKMQDVSVKGHAELSREHSFKLFREAAIENTQIVYNTKNNYDKYAMSHTEVNEDIEYLFSIAKINLGKFNINGLNEIPEDYTKKMNEVLSYPIHPQSYYNPNIMKEEPIVTEPKRIKLIHSNTLFYDSMKPKKEKTQSSLRKISSSVLKEKERTPIFKENIPNGIIKQNKTPLLERKHTQFALPIIDENKPKNYNKNNSPSNLNKMKTREEKIHFARIKYDRTKSIKSNINDGSKQRSVLMDKFKKLQSQPLNQYDGYIDKLNYENSIKLKNMQLLFKQKNSRSGLETNYSRKHTKRLSITPILKRNCMNKNTFNSVQNNINYFNNSPLFNTKLSNYNEYRSKSNLKLRLNTDEDTQILLTENFLKDELTKEKSFVKLVW